MHVLLEADQNRKIMKNIRGSASCYPVQNLLFSYVLYRRYSDWLQAGRPIDQSSGPGRVKNFLHCVQTGSGAHPASYPMGTGGSFPGVKRQGREADHSPPTSAEVKKMWIYTYTPPYAFMAYCLITELLGFRTLSIVRILIITRKKNKHDVSETGSVSVLR
jgi:hypothetical protein